MNDEKFDLLISAALKEYGSNYIDESILDNRPHDFSSEFQRKMNKLLNNNKTKMRITPKRFLTAIIAALIATCILAMSVSAIREAFLNFITNVFDTHTDVQSVEDTEAPLDFLDKYVITADMSDYEFISCSEDFSDIELIYEKEHCRIYFTQSIKKYFDVSVNTEGYEMETVYINGLEGYYIDMYNQSGKIVTWDNGYYILTILAACDDECDFGKDELILMAESVQKTEK